MTDDGKTRCAWIAGDTRMQAYHDEEWGVPVHDDRTWFEYLVLDAFQAGLSWRTVLHKREAFRAVFHDFDPGRVARMSATEIEDAMGNPAIIRNRQKITAAIRNARVFLELQDKRGSFDAFIWSFTGGEVVHNRWSSLNELPASTSLSDTVSKTMKQEGFSFVGTTICYAFLQAGGVVNDHLVDCFRHRELNGG
ncbi:MAG: DNA-3-methyladenine glycosylase I [Gammaproteobacteria bacterium]|jgi:DNA-3-methyladenine glycosylase I